MGRVAFEVGDAGTVFQRYPTLVLWGVDQTSRSSDVLSSIQCASATGAKNFVYLKWQVGETFFGGKSSDIDLLSHDRVASEAAGVDADVNGDDDGDIFFKLKPGIWRFYGQFKRSSFFADEQARLYRIVSGTDNDELLGEGDSTPNGEIDGSGLLPVIGSLAMLEVSPVSIAASDVLYFAYGDVDDLTNFRTHWMGMERLQGG